jgi:hypothetical protein
LSSSDAITARRLAAEGAPPAPAAARDVRPPALVLLAMVIVLYSLPVVAKLTPVVDPDIWWHLSVGKWVVEHRAVPQNDPLSAWGQTHPWVAYSWLFEVVVYGLYQWFGLTGILVFKLVVSGVLLVAIHRFVSRREPRFVWATALTLLAFIATLGLLAERPWLFTMLFTLFTLQTVLDLRAGTATRAIWLLPLAFVLWANLHIQFIYGLALLGLACVAPFIDAVLKRSVSGHWADTPGTAAWRQLLVLSVACGLATLVNPYHVRLYGVVLEYATQPVAFQVVNELKAMLFRGPEDWAFLALAGLGAFALGRRPARASVFELLLFAGAAVAGFRARRDTWLLDLVALAVVTSLPRTEPRLSQRFVFTPARVAIVAAAVAVVFGFMAWKRNLTEPELRAAVTRTYPAAAVAAIREKAYPGPIWNPFEWGGYLSWALPEYPVSMDGRTNLHGDERLARHYNTTHGLGWEKDPELMSTARLVIVNNSTPLPAALRYHPHFDLVYEDGQATVFVARPEPIKSGPAVSPP